MGVVLRTICSGFFSLDAVSDNCPPYDWIHITHTYQPWVYNRAKVLSTVFSYVFVYIYTAL